MVVGFTTTCAICEFKSTSWWGVLDTAVCNKVCQWLAAGWWFSLSNSVSYTHRTDYHDITETVLKVALSTNPLTLFTNFDTEP